MKVVLLKNGKHLINSKTFYKSEVVYYTASLCLHNAQALYQYILDLVL